MKKNILLFGSILFISSLVKGQALEKTMATYACKQLDSVNLAAIKTPEETDKVMEIVLTKTLNAHKAKIMADPRYKGMTTSGQGKSVGQVVGKKIYEILSQSCPVFKKIANTTAMTGL